MDKPTFYDEWRNSHKQHWICQIQTGLWINYLTASHLLDVCAQCISHENNTFITLYTIHICQYDPSGNRFKI